MTLSLLEHTLKVTYRDKAYPRWGIYPIPWDMFEGLNSRKIYLTYSEDTVITSKEFYH